MSLTAIQKVRLLIGDNDSASYVLSDAEVQEFLDDCSADPATAAPLAANAAANVLAMRAIDQTTGKVIVGLAKRAEMYRKRAVDLGGSAGSGMIAPPYVGGIDLAERETGRADAGRVQPTFREDMHDDNGLPATGDLDDDR